jgi:hypothetical protein
LAVTVTLADLGIIEDVGTWPPRRRQPRRPDGWRNRGRPAPQGTLPPARHHRRPPHRHDELGLAARAQPATLISGRKRAVPGWSETDGNEQMGVEVTTNGTPPGRAARSIAVTNAVVPRHSGRSDLGRYVWRHKDISLTGKWDIGQLTNRAVSQAPVTS